MSNTTMLALVDKVYDQLIATLRDELTSRVREVVELHSVILAQVKTLESRAALSASVETTAGEHISTASFE